MYSYIVFAYGCEWFDGGRIVDTLLGPISLFFVFVTDITKRSILIKD